MAKDDPFSGGDDPERTILVPSPGGRRRAGAPPPAAPPPQRHAPPPPADLSAPRAPIGDNPLINAAATLLGLARQLRDTPHCDDVPGLRDRAIEAVRAFELQAQTLGASADQQRIARYVLCSLIDEIVLNMPWGNESLWSTQSLLSTFYKEVVGGERFFVILQQLGQDPGTNLHLLELLYLCLALGFQGRYMLLERGDASLQQIEHNLYEMIQRQRGGVSERELSPHWQGVPAPRRGLGAYVPLWVVGVAAAALLVLVYVALSFALNRSSDLVYSQLGGIGIEGIKLSRPPPLYERVRGILEPEIRQRLVDVIDQGTWIRIVVYNKGIFASGSDAVDNAFLPLFKRIADAVKDAPPPILVTGHTDNQPIRTLRFPSNWHLSQARASAVATILARIITEPGKVTYEGRADGEPLAPNTTPEGREANRRVEVDVKKEIPGG